MSKYDLTGEITITAYRPFTTIDDDDFKFTCPNPKGETEEEKISLPTFVGTWIGRTPEAIF